jgi:hypothetical protein
MRFLIFLCFGLMSLQLQAQVTGIPDAVYMPTIQSIKLSNGIDEDVIPIIQLKNPEALQLRFDDMRTEVIDYFYTIQLCNADWTPVTMNPIEYLRGFSENTIRQYRFSSVALQKYVHYSLTIPNRNCTPTKAGNYVIKVYVNGDTSQLAFTRRFLVQDSKAGIDAYISQPTNPRLFKTAHKLNLSLNVKGLNLPNPFEQLKVVILQNSRWDVAKYQVKPRFIKGDVLEYNAEQDLIFPAMNEWRWIDLRSFRLQTERVHNTTYGRTITDVYVVREGPRSMSTYQFLKDINGAFILATMEDLDIHYEGDYARVHFTYDAPEPYAGYDLHIIGALTGNQIAASNKMQYNGSTRAYEGTLFLKQGYYNYAYALVDKTQNIIQTSETEGDFWEAENDYLILVYYRPLGGRHDELIQTLKVNSLRNRR